MGAARRGGAVARRAALGGEVRGWAGTVRRRAHHPRDANLGPAAADHRFARLARALLAVVLDRNARTARDALEGLAGHCDRLRARKGAVGACDDESADGGTGAPRGIEGCALTVFFCPFGPSHVTVRFVASLLNPALFGLPSESSFAKAASSQPIRMLDRAAGASGSVVERAAGAKAAAGQLSASRHATRSRMGTECRESSLEIGGLEASFMTWERKSPTPSAS